MREEFEWIEEIKEICDYVEKVFCKMINKFELDYNEIDRRFIINNAVESYWA